MSGDEKTHGVTTLERSWVRDPDSDLLRELLKLVEPAVVREGYELIDIEVVPERGGPVVRVYVDTVPPSDAQAGMSIEDCSRVSRQVGAVLDETDPVDGNYRLEISSPGLFRPLTKVPHFRWAVGQRIRVQTDQKLDGCAVFVGALQSIDEEQLRMVVDSREVAIPLSFIQKAHLEPKFS